VDPGITIPLDVFSSILDLNIVELGKVNVQLISGGVAESWIELSPMFFQAERAASHAKRAKSPSVFDSPSDHLQASNLS
jgi:hypothetical protein